jgi:hypothetical protein
LIPRWGAAGAVGAILSTLIVHNLGKQAGLGFGAGIGIVDRRHGRILGATVLSALVFNAALVALDVPLAVGLVVVAFATLLLIWALGPALELSGTLPELERLPLIRWLLR